MSDEIETPIVNPEVKTKKWKLPWSAKVGNKKIEKGWSTVITIRSNGAAEISKVQVKEGIAIVDGFPRIMSIEHKLTYKGKPLYILPEWSLKPFSPEDNYNETIKQQMNIAGRRAILSVLETEKIKPKANFGSFGWIILAIAIIGGLYYLAKSMHWI